MKRKLLFAAIMVIGALSQLRAQTDVTSNYLTNPSFESGDMSGWTAFGANNDDTPVPTAALASEKNLPNASGTYVCNYQWWCWSANTSEPNGISQTISQLPAGTYKLTAIVGAPNGWTVNLYANSNTSSTTMSADYSGETLTVTFSISEATNVTVKATVVAPTNVWQECNMRLDNFKLYKIVTIDTDLTSQFSALTSYSNWTGATGYTATNFCPAVETNAGETVQVCEKYESKCTTTGDIFYQTVSGLSPGTYRIELYGGAAFTFGRGFGSQAFTGETGTGDDWGTHSSDTYTEGDHIDSNTGVTLYAQTSNGTVSLEIPIYYATNFPDGAATAVLPNVSVGDNGEVKIGMSKTSKSTNWHVVQLKGVTATVDAASLLASAVSAATALEGKLPDDIWSDLEDVITENNKSYSTSDAYAEAIEAINDAREKALSDALAANKTAISDNKGDITSLINGNFTDNADGWSGGDYVTGLARNWHSGSDANSFYERKSDGTMSCTLYNMPAGSYKVVAASRTYDGGKMKAQVAGGSYGTELTGTGDATPAEGTMEINTNGVEMPYSSLGGFTTNALGHNWHWITATGTLASDGDLVINFTATGNAWMAIDDVHLYCTSLDGTNYTTTLNNITANRTVSNTGDKSVVTCDIITTNPNVILRSAGGGNITTAANVSMNNLMYKTSGSLYIDKLVLYDGYEYTDYVDGSGYFCYDATLFRNIPADTWCSLTIPFWPSTSLTKKYPSAFSNNTLTFDNLVYSTGLWNNEPMLVKSASAITAIKGARQGTSKGNGTGIGYGDQNVIAGDVTMKGTYSAITNVYELSGTNYVLGTDNKLYKVDSNVSLAPFRAYFTIPTGGDVKANVISLNFNDIETAISGIQEESTKNSGAIYNLAGQRVEKAQKGIYIINGKKVAVK